jgi:xylulokinase
MGKPHVLAIDLGTGGPKVALANAEGGIVGHEFEATELLLSAGGGAEQDPDNWWRAITLASRRLLERDLVALDDIEAISVTAQWSGTVPVDGSGRHLMNAVIWMDSRGAKYIGEVTGGPLKVQGYDARKLRAFIHKTGGIPSHSGKDPTAHILFIKHERPDVYRATATFLEPADYLNLRLCGRAVSSFDCITAHWVTDNRDIRNIHYDDHLIAVSGLERAKLPELVPSATVVGPVTPQAAAEMGVRPGTKVVTACGDVHSAVIGSGALADYAGHLYIGTSSWLSCHVPWKRTDILHNQASLPSALPGRYFIANEQESAGACLTFLRDNVFFADDELETKADGLDVLATFDRMVARTGAGSGRALFTPWLNGERTPVDDHTIRGGWHNVSLSTTRPELVRSVYEGVAFNSRWLLGVVEKFAKRKLPSLNFIGGGARSDVWCQIQADVLDREIRQVADPQQANVRGAAFLALIALGHATAEQLAQGVKISATFQPNPADRAVYDELFREFRNVYKHSKGIHARLNGARNGG